MIFFTGVFFMIYSLVWLLLLLKREQVNGVLLTPLVVFSIYEIGVVWPATLMSYAENRLLDGLPILIAGMAFLFFLLGFVLVSKYQLASKTFSLQKLEMQFPSSAFSWAIFILTLLLIGAGIYQYQGIPTIAYVFQVFISDSFNTGDIASYTSAARYELTKSHWFEGVDRGVGVVRIFARIGWAYLLSVNLLLYLETRNWKWLSSFVFLLLLAFVFVAGDGTRYPFLVVLLVLAITFSLYQRLPIRLLIIGGILGFFALVVMTISSSKGVRYLQEDSFFAISAIGEDLSERIFLGNGVNNVEIINFVAQDIIQYRMGQIHYERLLSSLPGISVGVPFAYELWQLMNPLKRGSTFATPTYLGILYADFGMLGVALGYLLLGGIIGFFYKLFVQKEKNILNTVLIANGVFFVGSMSFSGIHGLLVSIPVLLCFHILFFALLNGRVMPSVETNRVKWVDQQVQNQ